MMRDSAIFCMHIIMLIKSSTHKLFRILSQREITILAAIE